MLLVFASQFSEIQTDRVTCSSHGHPNSNYIKTTITPAY
ncbi:hypothetical protein COLO4_02822 [Corchorus olitorius]|uniref:Uncharacterized protein n=1 Tax=Corchorus olitorius TaxID=93759 RepID=A0A1R3L080_9ROSI|nr:hypothetical protein COLO4_02822 [Corchorus olitorius]